MSEPSYRVGVILVLIAGLLWSMMGLFIRLIETAGTWQILLYRSLGLVPVLFTVIALRAGRAPFGRIRRAGWTGVAGGVALVLAFSGAIFAIQSTSVANAVFLFAASPLLTAVLAWPLLREPVRGATWIAIMIAGVGMFLMVREGLALGAGWGNGAALVSALGFAIFTITLRRGRNGDMLPAVVIGGVLSILTAVGVLTLNGEPIEVPVRDMAIAGLMGALILGGGMAAYTAGSRAVPAAELTLLSMVEVMLAPVWVFVFLAEKTSFNTLVGGAVLLAAILFNAFSGMRHRPPPPLA
ncbi:DMT family transporter [Ostreiculturibacter nitratireducens]|uniref:DMT family transporter n=1 Tax=Ostreiculturibacter nitratireducens TaxID=3075226 RepID=UPI0031B56AFD